MFANIEGGQLQQIVVDEIDLGEGDDPPANAEQLKNAKVLLALRLPSLGGGDHEHAGVDRPHPRQHVP